MKLWEFILMWKWASSRGTSNVSFLSVLVWVSLVCLKTRLIVCLLWGRSPALGRQMSTVIGHLLTYTCQLDFWAGDCFILRSSGLLNLWKGDWTSLPRICTSDRKSPGTSSLLVSTSTFTSSVALLCALSLSVPLYCVYWVYWVPLG